MINCSLTSVGAVALAESFPVAKMKKITLRLGKNAIGDAGLVAIANAVAL